MKNQKNNMTQGSNIQLRLLNSFLSYLPHNFRYRADSAQHFGTVLSFSKTKRSFSLEPQENSILMGPQEVCSAISCSEQGQLQGQTKRFRALSSRILKTSKDGVSKTFQIARSHPDILMRKSNFHVHSEPFISASDYLMPYFEETNYILFLAFSEMLESDISTSESMSA